MQTENQQNYGHTGDHVPMDSRVQKMEGGVQFLKTTRVVFALGGVLFSVAGIVVAFTQARDVGVPAAVGIAVTCSLLGFLFATGVWFIVGRFMQSMQELPVRNHSPVKNDPTAQTTCRDKPTPEAPSPPPETSSSHQLDLNVELTAPVVFDGVDETLTFTAAHLFTQDDLRGNVDLIVSASPGHAPDHLTEGLLQRLQIGFDGRQTRLKALAHQPNDPDGSFLVVLAYSVTDLIGEFDRPQLERWLDELAMSPGAGSIYWDDRSLGHLRLIVADE